MLDIPVGIDDDGNDTNPQSRCQRMGALGLVRVSRDQHGITRAGDGGQNRMKALRRAAGYEAAEIGVPGLSRNLVSALKHLRALGLVVEALGGENVRLKHAFAKQTARAGWHHSALVMGRSAKADHRSTFERRQRFEDGGLVLIH